MKKSSKTFKVSDPSNNVYGFRVLSSGIKLASFLENPVCLLNHNYDKVMGSWEDVLLIGDSLQGVPVFDTADPEAYKYWGKVERNIIKGASIGIIPLSFEGDAITSCELLEISITPVPANRNSLTMYNKAGLVLDSSEARTYLLSIGGNTASYSASTMMSLIDNAITLNILTESSRQGWLNLANTDPETAYNTLSTLTASNSPELHTASSQPLINAPASLVVNKGWSFDDYATQDPAALALMQELEPDKFFKLYTAKARAVRLTGQVSEY